jgi:hypothetical protein
MSYKLYTDKVNKFSCNIQVEGTSLANSRVRLVVESDDLTYMFNGQIYDEGTCEVTIPKTKQFLPEGKKGMMRLEIIADDVYFEPWNSVFTVEQEKKVAVVVKEQIDTKPKITVEVTQPKEEKKPVVETKEPVKQRVVEKRSKNDDEVVLSKSEFLKALLGGIK